MRIERVWVIATTVFVCAGVVWGFDADGRYVQQAVLWWSGVMAGALLTGGGDE